jgi:hypothetical protein
MCVHKAFGVALIGLSEDLLSALDELLGPTVVEGLGGKQADAAVMVLGVVPGEEGLTGTAGVLNGAEALGELGPVLEGFEVTFREGVVVGDVGPAVGLGYAEIRQQEGHRLGGHRGAAVGMDGELSGGMACLRQVSAMRRLASSALWRWATIQPVR